MTIDDRYAQERARIIAQAAALDVNEANVLDYVQRWLDHELSDIGLVALAQYLVDSGRLGRVHRLMRRAIEHLIRNGLVTPPTEQENGNA